MKKHILISPSILSADFACLEDQIHQVEAAGADWIHIDVMDGHFVPNITMGPFIVETCRRITHLPLDVHLMIDNPELYIEAFAKAGASSLSVHIENTPNIHRLIQAIHSYGINAGIVLNPGTPPDRLSEILSLVDLVLVMSVNPGYSAQEFIPSVIQKIATLRTNLDNIQSVARLQVDGGITAATLPMCALAGADTFVAATAIFKYPQGIAAGLQALQSAVK